MGLSSGLAVSDALSDAVSYGAGADAESCGVGCGYGPAWARPGAEKDSVVAMTVAAIVLDGMLPGKLDKPDFRCWGRRWLKCVCGLRCVVIRELSGKGRGGRSCTQNHLLSMVTLSSFEHNKNNGQWGGSVSSCISKRP